MSQSRSTPGAPAALPRALRHTYFSLRHGHSVPNARGIICATMRNGTLPAYGLSATGEGQATAAGGKLAEHPAVGQASTVVFVSSPFTRALETARLASAALARARPGLSVRVVVEADLRERHFGQLELQPDTRYPEAWAEDAARVAPSPLGVEPVDSVWRRVRATVVRHDAAVSPAGAVVVLVSHGDTLQLTECGFRGQPLPTHRSLRHLNQAEFRCLSDLRPSPPGKL